MSVILIRNAIEDVETLGAGARLIASQTLDNLLAERDAALARLAATETALREDAAGRPLNELLTIAADLLDGYGGGPVADCLRLKADELAVLVSEPAAEETR